MKEDKPKQIHYRSKSIHLIKKQKKNEEKSDRKKKISLNVFFRRKKLEGRRREGK